MKKKIVACLLCMAMGVSTMPMPMVQAAVVYDETTGEETAEDTRTEIVAPSLSATAPAADETPKAVESRDYVTTEQVFKDAADAPAALTYEKDVTVKKEIDDNGDEVQAFSGWITAANDGENNDKFNVKGNTPMVIQFRMKTDKVSRTNWLIGKMDDQYGIQITPTTLDFYTQVGTNGSDWPTLKYTLPTDGSFWGKWHTVTAVYTGKTFKLYVDGVSSDKTVKDFAITEHGTSVFTIGYNKAKTDSDGDRYAGQFADMAIYTGTEELSISNYDDVTAALPGMTKIFDIDAQAEETTEPNYTVATKWTDNDADRELTDDDTFAEGGSYTLTAILTAKDGYKFTDDEDESSIPGTIIVGEGTADVVTSEITDGGKTMTLTCEFTVPADEVLYAKLNGLTGEADSEELTGEANGNGPIAKALDRDTDTYWHTNWKDVNKPKATYSDGKLTGNNTYTITLEKPSTVTSITYVPRNGYDSSSGKVNNGAIEQCNVYVTNDDTNWTLAGEIGENNAWSYTNQSVAGAEQNFVEKTVDFAQAYTGVTKVKIEAIKTAGPQPNQFINAAEFGVIGKENTAQEVLTAALKAAKDVKEKENYTEESYDAYKKALEAVNAITEESTDEEVQAAAKALQKAIAELVEVHNHTLTKTAAKAATCTEAGNSEYYTCGDCKKYFSDADGKNEIAENSWVIEAKGHKLTKTEAKAATCTEAGNSEYYTCSDCGKYFSDAEGKNEIAENSWVIEAKGHKLTKTEEKAATCTEAGNSEYYTCSDCGKYFSDAEGKNEIAENSWVIEAKGHKLTKTEAKAATCTEAGNSEYYTCSECGKYFSDAEGKNEIAENSWVIEAKGHKLTKTAAKAATCTAAGNSEYYTCSDCKKYFSDAAGKNEIAKDSWVIKAKGHTITKKETPATADKEGKIEYSCDVCKDYVEKTFVLPKTETSVYMGKTANLISDASKCSITLANAKKYKKYFTLDTKTGKIKTSTKKLSKVKIKKTIPVKVTVDGKAYNVNVKLKIAAPKIKIKRKKIVIGGVSGYRYELQYNIKGATRVKIRVKKMSVLNKKFDANMSKPKSSKSRCYINASSSGLKKLGNKLTFEIVAYYGKNVSQKFIKRI